MQKDINGVQALPSPPLLFLLQKAQQQIILLKDENSKLKFNADILEKKFEDIGIKNTELENSLEESKVIISNLNETQNILHEKVDVTEKENADLKHEKAVNEIKLKEKRNKHAEELRKLQMHIKDLEHVKKANDKSIHNLTRTLENTRAALQTCKSEKSQLKTCRTKLETKIR